MLSGSGSGTSLSLCLRGTRRCCRPWRRGYRWRRRSALEAAAGRRSRRSRIARRRRRRRLTRGWRRCRRFGSWSRRSRCRRALALLKQSLYLAFLLLGQLNRRPAAPAIGDHQPDANRHRRRAIGTSTKQGIAIQPDRPPNNRLLRRRRVPVAVRRGLQIGQRRIRRQIQHRQRVFRRGRHRPSRQVERQKIEPHLAGAKAVLKLAVLRSCGHWARTIGLEHGAKSFGWLGSSEVKPRLTGVAIQATPATQTRRFQCNSGSSGEIVARRPSSLHVGRSHCFVLIWRR